MSIAIFLKGSAFSALAAALAREFDATGRRLRCLVEVNTGEEPQKAGVPEASVVGKAWMGSDREARLRPVLIKRWLGD